jgi:hypothetical protein
VKIHADGEALELDAGKLHVLEVMAITEYTGLSLKDYQERLGNLDNLLESTDTTDFKCLQCVVWTARLRAGKTGPLAETDFDLTTLDFEVSEEEKTQAAAAAADAKATAKDRRTNPRSAARASK